MTTHSWGVCWYVCSSEAGLLVEGAWTEEDVHDKAKQKQQHQNEVSSMEVIAFSGE